MAQDPDGGPHDPFNVKYLVAILLAALLFPLMHIFVGIGVFL